MVFQIRNGEDTSTKSKLLKIKQRNIKLVYLSKVKNKYVVMSANF